MVDVSFSAEGRAALRRLDSGAYEAVVDRLEKLHDGTVNRSEVENEIGTSFRYVSVETQSETYTVVFVLKRRYGGREDKLIVVNVGPRSDFRSP